MSTLRKVAALAVAGAVISACGNSRTSSQSSTTESRGATATSAPSAPKFGDAPLPCGPAEPGATNTASDTGVTASTITIGAGDDRGFAESPGLDKEMTEAVQALADACNAAGGINGRQIVVKTYDAAILQVQRAMSQACNDKLFMLVGEGFALDASQEQLRLGCKLPAVPGYAVSAAFANAPLMYQGVPNPTDRETAESAIQMAKLFPDAIKASVSIVANFPADTETRDKVRAAYPKFGFTFLPHSDFLYPVTGQTDTEWSSLMRQVKATNAKLVYWVGDCTGLQKAMQAAQLNGIDVVWLTEANHYEAKCAASNTDGAMDKAYVRMAFVPFEEAQYSKCVQDYVRLIKAKSEQPSLLGMQSTSSFLLWATAAQQCGAGLTRSCVLAKIAAVHHCTGHGLHAASDPGANEPPQCGMLLKFDGTKYVQVAPAQPGQFDCDPNAVATVSTPASVAAKLDAQRVAHQYGG